MPGNELSIVIPVFNEAENISPLLTSLRASLEGLDWEVLLVDDDSPDGTAAVARASSLRDERVRLVLRVQDRGLFKACIQGLLSSKGDILCVMDADGQHDAAIIRDLIGPLRTGSADVVSAARQLNSPLGLSPARTRVSRLGNLICRKLLGREIEDPLTGFFAIRRNEFLEVVRKLDDAGFKLLLAILATDKKLRHQEIPFHFQDRLHGESKLDAYTIWQFLVYLLSQFTGGFIRARPLSFLLVGLSGLVVHFAVFWPALWLGAPFSVAQFGGALVATTSNFLLNNILTFSDRRLRGLRLLYGYAGYLIISAIGLVANVAMATVAFHTLKGMETLSALAGIAVDTVWKFVVSSRIVWKVR